MSDNERQYRYPKAHLDWDDLAGPDEKSTRRDVITEDNYRERIFRGDYEPDPWQDALDDEADQAAKDSIDKPISPWWDRILWDSR